MAPFGPYALGVGRPGHDARIVAAMNTYGIKSILTFNRDDFTCYPGLDILTPKRTLQVRAVGAPGVVSQKLNSVIAVD